MRSHVSASDLTDPDEAGGLPMGVAITCTAGAKNRAPFQHTPWNQWFVPSQTIVVPVALRSAHPIHRTRCIGNFAERTKPPSIASNR
jgi:hypothetical protein